MATSGCALWLDYSLPRGGGSRLVGYDSSNSDMVRQSEQAVIQPTQLALWTGLDNTLPDDGNVGMVGLAQIGVVECPRSIGAFLLSIAVKHGLVGFIFRARKPIVRRH